MRTKKLWLLILILWTTFARADELKMPDQILISQDEPDSPTEHLKSDQEKSPEAPPGCLGQEPTAREVVRAAWEQASLLPEEDRSRHIRARAGGYLPKVSAGISKELGDNWRYRYQPGTTRNDQLQQSTNLRWDTSVAWDLSTFAYNPDELQISRETVSRARERRNLATEVIRIFFARQKILRRGMPKPGSRYHQLLAEETAALDAWTDGRFQKQWCEVKP